MPVDQWIRGPFGIDAAQRVTRADCRSVLVMMPTMTAGTRLLDLAGLLATDHRTQTVFTVPDTTETWYGTEEFARDHGRMVIPWPHALQHRFDLVLAASYVGLAQVRGQVLVIPHGASSLMSRRFSRSGGPSARPHVGLARETLTHRGRLIPSVVALTHDSELAVLRRSCPEAVPRAVVAGDICYDRMLASRSLRASYRQALGVRTEQRLVTVSSTWATESTFGRYPELCRQLLDELPGADYRVALVLHPSVWAVHSRWQVRAWLAPCLRRGLLVIPPEQGWRATVIASDWVLGDHGSTTQYAAAIGTPVALATYPTEKIRAGSIADVMATTAPTLDLSQPVLPQLRCAGQIPSIAELITSRPTRSAPILRRAAYRLLDLTEPDVPAEAPPLARPRPIRHDPDHRTEYT
jgi:hypothetical protein